MKFPTALTDNLNAADGYKGVWEENAVCICERLASTEDCAGFGSSLCIFVDIEVRQQRNSGRGDEMNNEFSDGVML